MARRKKKNLAEIYKDILRRLYAESTPPADFDELYEKALQSEERGPDGAPVIHYNDYYLDGDRYTEIVEEELAKHKLAPREKSAVTFHAYLGCGPTSAQPKSE